ncbi:hypothetical protein [Paenibacillus cremeus]|uniref:Uncharacterized protein n=1 Tax=Paenibacillus cremeus TaxID=2163881 RepID=A0A559KFA4_9BACL|nr:hypothetical protein [Paenibacillus cremeus]TVY10801.1 hypothetical protein FPZ49_06795 [Paenibacillus cremeus]
MRTMKKVAWLLTSTVLVFTLIYGVIWIGDSPVLAQTSQEAKGQFVRVDGGGKTLVAVTDNGTEQTYPVADNVWVYRNNTKAGLTDLQKGDTLELILNSKSQLAYIKATAAKAAPVQQPEQAPAAAVTPPPAAQAQPQAAPMASQTPATGATAPQATAPSVQTAPVTDGGWPWKRLSLELKSRELTLKVKQEQAASDIYVQTKDHAVVHLKGTEAEKVLQLLLQGLPAERGAWEQALKQRLAVQFMLKDASPEWKVEVDWKDAAASSVKITPADAVSKPQPEPRAKLQEQQIERFKEMEKGKEKDKQKESKGKAKGHPGRGNDDDDQGEDD